MAKRDTASGNQKNLVGKRATRVLIVDDHALLRDGMRLMIDSQSDLEVCGEADDEADAVQKYRRLHPDLVIVDIALKTGSGIEAIKRIKGHDPDARIVVSSMHEETIYGERALLAGAMAFVSKQDPSGTLLTAMRQVLNGEMYFSSQLTQRLLRRASGTSVAETASPVDCLTDRELEAFTFIGQGLSSREIASRMHISPKTADRYRENIKRKLGIKSSSELIHHATLWVGQNH